MDSPQTDEGVLRVGDADRQAVAEQLISAHGLGQLDADEMTDRLEAAHTAKTRSDLAAITIDLPQPPKSTTSIVALDRVRAAITTAGAIAPIRRIALITLAALSAIFVVLMFIGGEGGDHEGEGPQVAEHMGGHEFDGGPSIWLLLIPIITAIVATAGWLLYHRRQQRS